jgi:GrpB-like predicted nucleotidyltransferase (UPF0157 family)
MNRELTHHTAEVAFVRDLYTTRPTRRTNLNAGRPAPAPTAAFRTTTHAGYLHSFSDTELGLAYGQVRLVDSDSAWPRAFERLAAELRTALGELAVAVEHVGSTAVPGLVAKPIPDLVVGLAPATDSDRVIPAIERLGHQFRGDKGDTGGLLFVLEHRPAHRIAHVHVVPHGGERWAMSRQGPGSAGESRGPCDDPPTRAPGVTSRRSMGLQQRPAGAVCATKARRVKSACPRDPARSRW